MTAEQWRDELVRLAMEAYDRVHKWPRIAFEAAVRERMAQAATEIGSLGISVTLRAGGIAAEERVASLDEAAARLVSWQDENGIGGSDCEREHGQIRDADGRLLGHITYNGQRFVGADTPL